MKKSFKDRVSELGLSYQKEVIFIIMINVLVVGLVIGLYFFTKEWLVLVAIPLLCLGATFVYTFRYSSIEKAIEKEHVDELVSLLSYFEIFVYNGNNIYQSFQLLIPYCSSFMEDAIGSLLSAIDVDKSVGPFINFALKFNNRLVDSLMLSIYQMVDNGANSNQFSEFDALFSSLNKDFHNESIQNRINRLNALDSWPLIGSGAVTIVLAISILNIVGDYINVL